MNIVEKREYFREFRYEPLTSRPENKRAINEFVSKRANNTLEDYLRDEDKAWADDLSGETRVYLVKDKAGDIALFFSLKCGLLVGENPNEKLSDEHEDFVDAVIDVMKIKDDVSIQKMYEAGMSMYGENVDRLFEISRRRLDAKTESTDIGQSENTINVPSCISAIELRHLCRNDCFVVPDEIGIPLGFGVFWEMIVPLVVDITKKVGCKYLYLFAADTSDGQNESKTRKLVSYYKNNFKFSECDEGIKFVKPEYDNYCYGLMQRVSDLERNRETIWHEFSDI